MYCPYLGDRRGRDRIAKSGPRGLYPSPIFAPIMGSERIQWPPGGHYDVFTEATQALRLMTTSWRPGACAIMSPGRGASSTREWYPAILKWFDPMRENSMRIDSVRWMVSFWHPDGGSKTEPNFPQVDFWHADRETSMAEAARVLIELREEREDERDWVASGHPDPFEVGAGRHPGGQWILRYSDLKPASPEEQLAAKDRLRTTRSVAGAWKGNGAAEDLQGQIAARRGNSPADPGR